MFCGWIKGTKGAASGCYNSTRAQKHLTKQCEEGKLVYAAFLAQSLTRENVAKEDLKTKRKSILYTRVVPSVDPGQRLLPGVPTWQDVALSYQGHFIVYSRTCMPLGIVKCPDFSAMLNAQIPDFCRVKAPILTPLRLEHFIDVEYEVMKDNIKEVFATVKKDSKGNPFMQLFHDGITLGNQSKCQAIAGQIVHPKWDRNLVFAFGFRKVLSSTGEVVSALAE